MNVDYSLKSPEVSATRRLCQARRDLGCTFVRAGSFPADLKRRDAVELLVALGAR